ncbi:hypothetical protein BJV82DRAFT_591619 [Fennellomyces sp. T-0311]|nr:hypothetical protein BJV82DRAFT_591619 [Fennellomyces sp. T-0311]
MYFHSSSYRHEQYAALRSANNRADKKKKKRSSLSSNTSGADSGYTSSASSSPNATQPSPLSARVAAEAHVAKATEPSSSSGATTPKKPKKKRSGTKNQLGPPRQPDLVYSCPRPLAFPFHNDAHFLPVAEADPRDVARVAPPSSRRQSAASSKASSLASSQFDQHSAYRYRSLRSKSSYDDDTETLRSRQSSVISSMQRGTVRSLRSLFQIPTPHHPPVEERSQRPEIKKGTVRHIREMFNSDEATSSNLAIAERNAEANSRKPRLFDRITGRKPIQQNQRSRASSVTSTATTLCNKPLPKAPTNVDKLLADAPPVPTKPPSAFSTLKRMFSRPSAKKQSSSSSPASQASPASLPKKVTVSPTTTSIESPAPVPSPPTPPKRSILSTWLRPDPPKPVDQPKPKDSTKPKDQPKPAQVEPQPAPTVVGRLWKSFKRMVTGKKTSRVGVL